MKILQINTTVNFSAPGKIAEDIGVAALAAGHESFIAYGRDFNDSRKSKSNLIKIGDRLQVYNHLIQTRLFDCHGLCSRPATDAFIKKIDDLKPDIIHLHNVHGYYLNYRRLFSYLASLSTPVVWTLHDCWAYTGHCAYYSPAHCTKWQTGCGECPLLGEYPSAFLRDRSRQNFETKQHFFNLPENLTLVAPTDWLRNELKQSFLSKHPVEVIHNGVDLEVFKPYKAQKSDMLRGKKIILGVANVWEERKGLADFIALRDLLPRNYAIILVGLSPKQMRHLPDGIIGKSHTNDARQLAEYYNVADVFVNPTKGETFGLTNIEAMACGTPVVMYNVAGSPEVIDENTGRIVPIGDINALTQAITTLPATLADSCIRRAQSQFSRAQTMAKYLALYKRLSS